MAVKVTVPIKRAGEDREAEVIAGTNGTVEIFVPSVGSHRICRFEIDPKELAKAATFVAKGT